MATPANPDDPADAEAMARHARTLADAMVEAIPRWVRRTVLERALAAGVGREEAVAVAEETAQRAVTEAEPSLRALLEADIDAQATTPLAILRSLVSYPNEALDRLGVPHPKRAQFEIEAFPGDTHGLSPAAFAAVDPALHEPGIIWGAAKAHIHLRRHKH